MKKTISIITIMMLLVMTILTGKVFADSLDTIEINIDKTTVKPGEGLKVTVEFGKKLGAYTFDFAYDNKIFSYVTAEGGTANDLTDKVRVTYYDSTGGTNPRENMSIIFKAKDDITTSNPTEITVTAEGLSNEDASITYDDITSPIVKNITVEPQYVDYTLNLEATGNLIQGKENEMKLSYSSPMGRYYEHARLIASATTPKDGTVNLIGIDENNLEHDIIQNGWGDAQGYKIGGKDVLQVLNLRGTFSKTGDYTITLKLIDRDNSDSVIAEKTFNFTVTEENKQPEDMENTTPEQNEITNEAINETKDENTNMPTVLPKTGINIYIPIIATIILLATIFAIIRKKK